LTELKNILYKVTLNAVVGSTSISTNELHFDSRKVDKKDVFVAIKGLESNGHDYIEKAIKQGAIAIICEKIPKDIINNVTYVEVDSTKKALAIMASNYYEVPSNWHYWN